MRAKTPKLPREVVKRETHLLKLAQKHYCFLAYSLLQTEPKILEVAEPKNKQEKNCASGKCLNQFCRFYFKLAQEILAKRRIGILPDNRG